MVYFALENVSTIKRYRFTIGVKGNSFLISIHLFTIVLVIFPNETLLLDDCYCI